VTQESRFAREAGPQPPPRRGLPLLLAAVLLSAPCRASLQDEEPLETDRPDFSETSSVVGPGRLQIETSVLRELREGRGGDERALFTPTLFRVGVNPRWEARLETGGYSRLRLFQARPGALTTSGYSPLDLGVKHRLQEPREGSRRPALSGLLHLGLPTGSGVFATRRLTAETKLLADWDLAPRWGLGANVGLALAEDDAAETFLSGLFTAALARELTSQLRVYGEVVFQGPEQDRGGTALLFDGGFAYLLNPNTQFDVAVGTGLSGRTPPDLFWTIGFSRRW